MPTYPYFSRMVQILNVKLGNIFNETKHILVLGGSGSGKTSALLLWCYLFKQNGETILWRDDSSTEWLSLVNEFPWRCFVPQNCEFSYKHANIEYIPYDPWDLKTLFKEVKRGQAHAIEFDPYTMDIAVFVDFWSRFFFDLYKWKGPDIRSKVCFITDELNDLAAGARRGFVPRQLQLASRIYLSLKKYRKERIRLLASSHGYGDLHKPVREGFNYYIFKRMDPGSIPDQFRRYDKVIGRLDLNEMFIVDENKSFNTMEIEELVKPRRVSVRWKGTVAPISVKKADELAQWKGRITTLVEVLHNVYDVPYKMISPALGYAEQSGLNNLVKKYNTKDVALHIETLSKQIRQLEQEQAE